MADPRVSIVTATYRRPLVLRHAIASVLGQDMPEWELIVVGDGCRDETEEVVRGFADPRIRFVNLPANSGCQSAPNNEGVRLARAPMLAFLNQDDLWFPDHLSRGLAFHETSAAGVSVAPMLVLADGTAADGAPDPARDVARLDGATPDGRWGAEGFFLASCWLLRREAAAAVGPWLPAKETRLSPSQEWLHRAARRGVGVVLRPRVTILCLHGAARRGSYIARRSVEHERAAAWVAAGEAVRATLFEMAALRHAREQAAARRGPGRLVRGALAGLGLHPDAVRRWLGGVGKGRWVAEVYARGRAAPEPPIGRVVSAADPALSDGYAAGWHAQEAEGRWTASADAELLLRVPAAGLSLRLTLRSLTPQTATLRLDGRPVVSLPVGPEPAEAVVPLPEAGPVCIGLSAERTTRPCDIAASADSRALGLFLSALALDQSGSDSHAGSASGGANSGPSSGGSGAAGRP